MFRVQNRGKIDLTSLISTMKSKLRNMIRSLLDVGIYYTNIYIMYRDIHSSCIGIRGKLTQLIFSTVEKSQVSVSGRVR